jgi:hypothetical protein
LQGRNVVDNEGDARVLLYVAVLLPLGEAAMTADFDRVVGEIVSEGHRDHVRLAAGSGGEATEALALQIGDLAGGESAHSAECDAKRTPFARGNPSGRPMRSRHPKPRALVVGRLQSYSRR